MREGFRCIFHDSGFWQRGLYHPGCKVFYHPGCISVGQPFTSRFRDARLGLDYNPHLLGFPFICERCTVLANVMRDLEDCVQDMQLLMLERMRMIDASNAWAEGTRITMASKLRRLRGFLDRFNILAGALFPTDRVHAPPDGPGLPLLWAMEHYVLQPSPHRDYDTITYNTSRGLRTCLHQYLSWLGSLMPEGTAYREKDRVFLDQDIGASGSLVVQLSTKGMERRLGTASKPSVALKAEHIHYNQARRRDKISQLRKGTAGIYQLLLAQLAELLAWLAWLRASELFGLRWQDIEMVRPGPRPAYGFPPGSGALLLQLLEATKSSQTITADMVIAYLTASGLCPGQVFEELLALRPRGSRDSDLIFLDEEGEVWTSAHFRHTYVYPLLEEQWRKQDPVLRTHCPQGLEQIRQKFYSLSMFRRGGRTHVARKRPGCIRKAEDTEITEHGRWRIRYKVHRHMPTHYLEFTYEDKIYITLLCM